MPPDAERRLAAENAALRVKLTAAMGEINALKVQLAVYRRLPTEAVARLEYITGNEYLGES